MRVFLLCVCLAIFVVMASTVFSLDFDRLSEYGWGYLAGKAILMLIGAVGVFFTARSIFKKISV